MLTKSSKIKTAVNLIALAESNGYGGPWLDALYLTLSQMIASKRYEIPIN